MPANLIREETIEAKESWRELLDGRQGLQPVPPTLRRFLSYLGQDHVSGCVYGMVNLVICVPSLVSYAHIVFPQREFVQFMPSIVKIYFLSSAVMQVVMTLLSSILFSIGQIQDVGLIFLAGMVRNIVFWGRKDGLSPEKLVGTGLWQCLSSTVIVGLALICVGKCKVSQYVQMLPLPVVGGYLGYIGYFCLAAGLGIGSGREVNGPETLLQLFDWELWLKMSLLLAMTVVMLIVHYKVHHFMGMPILLLVLPVVFFVGAAIAGVSIEECREAGLLPQPRQEPDFQDFIELFSPSRVQGSMLKMNAVNVVGLLIIVTFGSSLDIVAIQAEMAGQKIDFNEELVTIGVGNLVSGICGGATGSYIFSQTIFSAKRGVQSRLNGIIVGLGELILFFLPLDILQVLPNSYIGGIMCLLGVDIMLDWLVKSRHLMSWLEYCLVWLSFGATMWLTSSQVFGVIEGMLVGTVVALAFFPFQFANVQDKFNIVSSRSSVIRPPMQRRHLNSTYNSVLAISLNSFAFFGVALSAMQKIEALAEERKARFVCIDLGRLSGMDCTSADQMRLLVLSLEKRLGIRVFLSSIRASAVQQLLEAHSVLDDDSGRQTFPTLDQALQRCEEIILGQAAKLIVKERSLEELLLDYVEGFGRTEAYHATASRLAARFRSRELRPREILFRGEDPADTIYVIARGSLKTSTNREWVDRLGGTAVLLASPQTSLPLGGPGGIDTFVRNETPPPAEFDEGEGEYELIGVGSILNDTAFYARRKCGVDAAAQADGCTVYQITRSAMEQLELEDPSAAVLLQKVLLRDLSQLMVQFLFPLQSVAGLT
mmetsp:Transcript_46327/g.108549  ORF Transcript_46327/g.108549 Transcript_46327/m.108549 type:complete len:824 (-) Transcript_46327:54-2525(-)